MIATPARTGLVANRMASTENADDRDCALLGAVDQQSLNRVHISMTRVMRSPEARLS